MQNQLQGHDMKATLVINKEGKITIENLPANILPGEYTIACNILFSVGTLNPKKVSSLNRVLFTKARSILKKNAYGGGHMIGWCGLSKFIDHLEENYDIKKKQMK
jgi:hypothetical protein